MLAYTSQSIFDSDAGALVCPITCDGLMLAPLEREFLARWPSFKDDFQIKCNYRQIRVGVLFIWDTQMLDHSVPLPEHRFLIGFPTRESSGEPSRLEYIETGLKVLAEQTRTLMRRIALPQLGCGEAGSRGPTSGN